MFQNKQFRFWFNWLFIVSVLHFFMGFIIAFFPGSFLFGAHTSALSEAFFGGMIPEQAEQMRRFFFGIIGGTIAGYFLIQTLIVLFPFRKRERWAWHAIFWAILIWFFIDSLLSISRGAFFNVWMINIPSLLLTLIPLLFTQKFFRPEVQDGGMER